MPEVWAECKAASHCGRMIIWSRWTLYAMKRGPRSCALRKNAAGLMGDLRDLLGTEIDLATTKGLHPYIRDRVLAEAQPL